MTKIPRKGSGRLQWNTGGWFGSQIGSSLWLLGVGIFVFCNNPLIGVLVLFFFFLPNLVGWFIWFNRDRIEPHPAAQAIFGMIGLSSLCAVIILDLTGFLIRMEPGLRDPPKQAYGYLLIFPALMVFLHVQNGQEEPKPFDK